MSMESQNYQEICRAAIEGNMTIYEVGDLQDQLVKKAETCECLVLDLSQVNEIDTAGLQLLVMLKKMLIKHNKSLRLHKHSASVTELIGLCDLAEFFGDSMGVQDVQA